MTAAITALFMLGNTWYTPGTTVTTLKMQDVNGTTISVGDTVKIVCKVTALNPTSTHFDNVSLTPVHPGGDPRVNPASALTFNVHPLNLVSGS